MRPMGKGCVALSKPVWMVAADLIADSICHMLMAWLVQIPSQTCCCCVPRAMGDIILFWWVFMVWELCFLWVSSLFPCPYQYGDTRTKGHINLCLGKSPVQGYSWNFSVTRLMGRARVPSEWEHWAEEWAAHSVNFISPSLFFFFFFFDICFVSILSVFINLNFHTQRVRAEWLQAGEMPYITLLSGSYCPSALTGPHCPILTGAIHPCRAETSQFQYLRQGQFFFKAQLIAYLIFFAFLSYFHGICKSCIWGADNVHQGVTSYLFVLNLRSPLQTLGMILVMDGRMNPQRTNIYMHVYVLLQKYACAKSLKGPWGLTSHFYKSYLWDI